MAQRWWQGMGRMVLVGSLGIALGAAEPIATVSQAPVPPSDTATDLHAPIAAATAAATAGEVDKATAILQALVAAHPTQAQAWDAYGEHLRFLVHDRDRAREAFSRALQAPQGSPADRAAALTGLGTIAAAAGDGEAAIRLLRQSLAICALPETHRQLSVLLLVVHQDPAAALVEAQAAASAAPEPLSLLVEAILLQRTGHSEEGRQVAAQALQLAGCSATGEADHPVHCCVFYNAACYAAVCGHRAQALALLRAFFRAPNHLHRSRAEILADPDLASLHGDPAFQALLDAQVPDRPATSP